VDTISFIETVSRRLRDTYQMLDETDRQLASSSASLSQSPLRSNTNNNNSNNPSHDDDHEYEHQHDNDTNGVYDHHHYHHANTYDGKDIAATVAAAVANDNIANTNYKWTSLISDDNININDTATDHHDHTLMHGDHHDDDDMAVAPANAARTRDRSYHS
jgi:hypothetical protein